MDAAEARAAAPAGAAAAPAAARRRAAEPRAAVRRARWNAADGHGRRAGTGGAAPTCKRGIAANTAPGAAFFPAVRWWYNWASRRSGGNTGIEFVPMVWGSSTVNGTIPAGSKFLLGFNEPNFNAQSNLTPQAAAPWPTLQTKRATRASLRSSGPR